MYRKRAIEKVLQEAANQTKVVLLTGARQVGKSTVMQHVFPNYGYYTLDDVNELALAKNDAALFFQEKQKPLIIDEVQYAPELFRRIKLEVDREKHKGQIFLTGSQRYELMNDVAESLAGRITVIELAGLSLRELSGDETVEAFIPSRRFVEQRAKQTEAKRAGDIWELIHRGGMPELLDPQRKWDWFYRDYVRTYIERDVRQMVNVKDELKFRNFLIALAARSGQMLVYGAIAGEVGVDTKTVQQWTSVVQASGLIRIVQPYHNNALKRIVKTPKVYFMDTGLLCHLIGWTSPTTAKNGAMSGHIFETFVVSEIIKSHLNAGGDASQIYYYRDRDGCEVDLLIEEGQDLYPVEIKKSATIDRQWTKNIRRLPAIASKTMRDAVVVCQVEKAMSLGERELAIPLRYI